MRPQPLVPARLDRSLLLHTAAKERARGPGPCGRRAGRGEGGWSFPTGASRRPGAEHPCHCGACGAGAGPSMTGLRVHSWV